MAKISELPVKAAPEGDEPIIILDGPEGEREAKLATIGGIVSAAFTPVLAAATAVLNAIAEAAGIARDDAGTARDEAITARDLAFAASQTDPTAKRPQHALIFSAFAPPGIGGAEIDCAGRLIQGRQADGSNYVKVADVTARASHSALILAGFAPAGTASPSVDRVGRLIQAVTAAGTPVVVASDATGKSRQAALIFAAFAPVVGPVDGTGRVLPGGVARDTGLIQAGRQAPASGMAYLTGVTPNRSVAAFLDDGRTITISKPGDDPDLIFQSGDIIKYRRTTAEVAGDSASMVNELLALEVFPSGTTLIRPTAALGQSNAGGYGISSPAIITTAPVRPGRVLMSSRGVRLTQATLTGKLPFADIAGLRDAFEQRETTWPVGTQAPGETPMCGLGYAITGPGGAPSTTVFPIATFGFGGAHISELSKGTRPYANFLRWVQRQFVIGQRANIPVKVLEVPWIQGEADIVAVGNTSYKTSLAQFQTDLDTDIKAITGQAETVRLVGAQISSWTSAGNVAQSDTPLAILELAIQYPARFICSGPMYRFPFIEPLHLSWQGQRNHGEQIGHVIARADAGTAKPFLHATAAVRAGTTVTVTLAGAEGALAIDTAIVSDPGQYGIRFAQTGGNNVTVTGVAVAGSDTMTVTLSDAPTGANPVLEFGLTGTVGANGGPTTGPRTCIRDTSASQCADGSYRHNYLCHQRIAIT